MSYKIVDECKYSFSDLFGLVGWEPNLNDLSQSQINELVKKACANINWYWEDRMGTDGLIYTAFSPIRTT